MDLSRRLMDENDEQYRLAGQLLGTAWNHEDYGIVEIESARQNVVREQGERMTHPEVVMSNGKRIDVSGFRYLIGQGVVEPAGDGIAEQIATEIRSA